MSAYKLILLDADGTLLDFSRSQQEAFYKAFQELGHNVDEHACRLFVNINNRYWTLHEQGKLTKEEIQYRRFADLLQVLALGEMDPVQVNQIFLRYLGTGNHLLPGAENLCRKLSRHVEIAIATNGVARTQRQRINSSAIAPYISHIITSEEAQAAKPFPAFFAYAMRICGIADKSAVLMAGDSLAADVEGAIRYGIDSCWVNYNRLPRPEHLPITAIVHTLDELYAFATGNGE